MKELKPCPFCGSEVFINVADKDMFGKCGEKLCICCNMCETTGPLNKTKEQAIKAWNRRTNE